ncbi:MAG: hypothetical protein GKS06_05030 [Acidobacteria bacterium]|nr:hypothetical protein [Acidobacteriota bacterium]
MLIKLRNRNARPANQTGFTLVEVAGILLALGVLVAVLVPNIGRFNSLARTVRVKEDLGAICSSLKVMMDDLGLSAYWGAGGGRASMTGFASSGSSTIVGGGMDVSQSTDMIEWCVNCDMPSTECSECAGDDCTDDHCYDDCGPECGTPEATVMVPVTTQTYTAQPGQRVATGGSTTVGYSYYGSYGYGGYYSRPLGLMVGEGRVPGSAIGWTEWQLEYGNAFARSTIGYNPIPVNFWVGSLGNQLIHHNPTYYAYTAGGGYGNYGAGYGTGGIHAQMIRWRGPYIADEIIADPWGNRYMVNSFGLHVPSGIAGYGTASGAYGGRYGGAGYGYGHARYVAQFGSATVCYSAGPNGMIETPFDQPAGWYTGGDDLTVVLSGAGGIR